ncbi:MAG: hypothetical protein ABIR80_05115 [Opitutaceae bacterium]
MKARPKANSAPTDRPTARPARFHRQASQAFSISVQASQANKTEINPATAKNANARQVGTLMFPFDSAVDSSSAIEVRSKLSTGGYFVRRGFSVSQKKSATAATPA